MVVNGSYNYEKANSSSFKRNEDENIVLEIFHRIFRHTFRERFFKKGKISKRQYSLVRALRLNMLFRQGYDLDLVQH